MASKTYSVILERTQIEMCELIVDADSRMAAGFGAAKATPQWQPREDNIKVISITPVTSE